MEIDSGIGSDNWDEDDFEGAKQFGDRAKFVMKIGDENFPIGAWLVFKCCECNKPFTVGSEHLPILWLERFVNREREEQKLIVGAQVSILSKLMGILETCVCDYHPPHRFRPRWGFRP